MWRTFAIACKSYEEFDRFLESIEEAGYQPVLLREQYRIIGWNTIIDVAVTARKKDA